MRIEKYLLFIIFFSLLRTLSAGNNIQLDSLLKKIETAKDTTLINSLLRIAEIQLHSNKDTAIYYLGEAEKEATKINFDEGYSEALFMHGNLLYFKNNFSLALGYFNKALDLAKEVNNDLLKAQCLERLASLHLTTGDSNLALKLYFESLSIFEVLNDQKGMAKVYNILSIYKAETGEFELAQEYLRKSLAIHEVLLDSHNIIENKANLGYVYELLGETDAALDIYTRLIPEIQDDHTLSVLYYNISSIYQDRSKKEIAMDYLLKAIILSETLNDQAMLSSLFGNLGQLLLEQNKTDSARQVLEQSVSCAQAIGDLATESQSLVLLIKIDSMQNNNSTQMQRLKRVTQLQGEIFSKQLENNLKASELQYENQKSQRVIYLQEQIISSNKGKKQLFITLILISILGVFLMIWLFILQRRAHINSKKFHDQQIRVKQLEVESLQQDEELQKMEKQKAQEALNQKEQELVCRALQLDQKKVELSFIRKELKGLMENEPLDILRLQELDKTIKRRMKANDSWDFFSQTFSQVHQDFFEHIKSKHPDLSKTELKFCAYLRIHLSSSQISTLLNVSNDAIRKTRHRLRKKFELDLSIKLEDYIQKF